MKKNIAIIVVLSVSLVVGILLLLSCYLIDQAKTKKTSVRASLIVNNSKKNCMNAFITKSGNDISATIPFSAIQEDINAFLSWKEDGLVLIICNDTIYCLDLKEAKLLVNEASGLWAYIIAPGTQGNAICEKKGDDIVFDSVTLSSLLSFLDIKMRTTINMEAKTISVLFLPTKDE